MEPKRECSLNTASWCLRSHFELPIPWSQRLLFPLNSRLRLYDRISQNRDRTYENMTASAKTAIVSTKTMTDSAKTTIALLKAKSLPQSDASCSCWRSESFASQRVCVIGWSESSCDRASWITFWREVKPLCLGWLDQGAKICRCCLWSQCHRPAIHPLLNWLWKLLWLSPLAVWRILSNLP